MNRKTTHFTPTLALDIQYLVPFKQVSIAQVRRWVEATLKQVAKNYNLAFQHFELTIRFSTIEEIQALNAAYRQQNKPTNVLTFAYGINPDNQTVTADVILCAAILQDEAKAQSKGLVEHTAHLCVHGVLHALGFEHKNTSDANEMENLEIEILKQFEIANPYLIKDTD